MNHRRTPATRRLLASLTVGVVVLAACGSDDETPESSPAGAPAEPAANDAEADSGDGSEVLADNGPRDEILDGVDPDGELDDAIGALDASTRYEIVAGQLDPEPGVFINGNDIRLVFPDGSVDNATFDCILASVTQLDTETLTLVYPDGEEVC